MVHILHLIFSHVPAHLCVCVCLCVLVCACARARVGGCVLAEVCFVCAFVMNLRAPVTRSST